MAIYGLNFNGLEIPPGVKRKFGNKICIRRAQGKIPSRYVFLKGVAQSPEERDAMLIVANNGHRVVHVEERKTASGIWYGIYVD